MTVREVDWTLESRHAVSSKTVVWTFGVSVRGFMTVGLEWQVMGVMTVGRMGPHGKFWRGWDWRCCGATVHAPFVGCPTQSGTYVRKDT